MECDITRSMFSIRMCEMRVAWMSSRDSMIVALHLLTEHITNYQTIHHSLIETCILRSGKVQIQNYVNSVLKEELGEQGTLSEQHVLSTLAHR